MVDVQDIPSLRAAASLPRRADVLKRLVAAEKSVGWIAECDDRGEYLILCRELVAALTEQVNDLPSPIVEIGSGQGILARALREHGVSITASDISPPAGARQVVAIDARSALSEFQPRSVITCFAPVDAGFDEAVLECASVQQYLVLQTRQQFSQFFPLLEEGWNLQPLPTVSRMMVTRHDTWLADAADSIRHAGQAWLLSRHAS